jgi:hypothetical protein
MSDTISSKKKLVISVFLWSLLEAVVRMLAGTC